MSLVILLGIQERFLIGNSIESQIWNTRRNEQWENLGERIFQEKWEVTVRTLGRSTFGLFGIQRESHFCWNPVNKIHTGGFERQIIWSILGNWKKLGFYYEISSIEKERFGIFLIGKSNRAADKLNHRDHQKKSTHKKKKTIKGECS